MTVAGSLADIGVYLGIEAAALERYAAQDHIGGYPHEWTTGSLWAVEGQFLYALTMCIGVHQAVEFGTHVGCSATHIAQAIHDARFQHGDWGAYLHAVDIWSGAGDLIPVELRRFVIQHFEDMVTWAERAANDGRQFELIFEDGPHDEQTVSAIWSLAPRLLAPGGVIVSHDALHDTAGPHIRAGIAQSGITPIFANLGTDCGLAIWRRD